MRQMRRSALVFHVKTVALRSRDILKVFQRCINSKSSTWYHSPTPPPTAFFCKPMKFSFDLCGMIHSWNAFAVIREQLSQITLNEVVLKAPESSFRMCHPMILGIAKNELIAVVQGIKENYPTSASWQEFAEDGEHYLICILQIWSEISATSLTGTRETLHPIQFTILNFMQRVRCKIIYYDGSISTYLPVFCNVFIQLCLTKALAVLNGRPKESQGPHECLQLLFKPIKELSSQGLPKKIRCNSKVRSHFLAPLYGENIPDAKDAIQMKHSVLHPFHVHRAWYPKDYLSQDLRQ